MLAKALRADAVLITWIGGGNAFVDVMNTVRACERNGIKTTLVTYEHGGKEGKESPLLYYVAEADAVVTTGALDRPLELPAVDRVIGPYREIKLLSYPGVPAVPASGPLSMEARDAIIGGADLWGQQSWKCVEY
jgi:glycine reductase